MDLVGTIVKGKTKTLNNRCNESAERETKLHKMVEAAAMDEKQEQKNRGMIGDLLGELRKRRAEEEARNLIEEVQHISDEAQNKSYQVEWKLNSMGIHRGFRQGTRTSTVHNNKALADDAEQRYKGLKPGQKPR